MGGDDGVDGVFLKQSESLIPRRELGHRHVCVRTTYGLLTASVFGDECHYASLKSDRRRVSLASGPSGRNPTWREAPTHPFRGLRVGVDMEVAGGFIGFKTTPTLY